MNFVVIFLLVYWGPVVGFFLGLLSYWHWLLEMVVEKLCLFSRNLVGFLCFASDSALLSRDNS